MIDLKDMRRRAKGLACEQGSYGPTFASPSEVIELLDMLEAVQKDAARYRWLRDGDWRESKLEPVIRLQLNGLWDEKIDAAMESKQ